MLDRRHEETVGHEANRTFEVEWRREFLRIRDDIMFWPRIAAVEVVNFDSKEIVFAGTAFAIGALANGG